MRNISQLEKNESTYFTLGVRSEFDRATFCKASFEYFHCQGSVSRGHKLFRRTENISRSMWGGRYIEFPGTGENYG